MIVHSRLSRVVVSATEYLVWWYLQRIFDSRISTKRLCVGVLLAECNHHNVFFSFEYLREEFDHIVGYLRA